jgi:hypothetical protein
MNPAILLKINEMQFEEKGFNGPEKLLTGIDIGSIVKKVPRGLRNSKPAET